MVDYLSPDGTAVITAEGPPPEQAAGACERVGRLARAVKRAGHPGGLDQIRADVFLGLLDGRFHGLTRRRIIDALLGSAAGPAAGIEVRVELATLLGAQRASR